MWYRMSLIHNIRHETLIDNIREITSSIILDLLFNQKLGFLILYLLFNRKLGFYKY